MKTAIVHLTRTGAIIAVDARVSDTLAAAVASHGSARAYVDDDDVWIVADKAHKAWSSSVTLSEVRDVTS